MFPTVALSTLDVKNVNMISRIGWYWQDLVFSIKDVDPAFLFTIIELFSTGNKYHRVYVHSAYAKYISKSPYWAKLIIKENLKPEDLCSNYGLFNLPYFYAYSFGFKNFDFNLLYDVDIALPYVVKYIKKLYRIYHGNLTNIFGNYGYYGKITDKNLNVLNSSYSLRVRRRLLMVVYSMWKTFLKERGLWYETIY